MFGDTGHGLCLLVASIFALKYASKSLHSIFYMILMMSLFSIFCGWIYNEFFSVPILLQPSCYIRNEHKFDRQENCVYGFGMDHVWAEASNETAFINSFKMKFAIVVGVV